MLLSSHSNPKGKHGPARFDPDVSESVKVYAFVGAGSNVAPELTYLRFSGGFLTLITESHDLHGQAELG
jgi:hypothetical protein